MSLVAGTRPPSLQERPPELRRGLALRPYEIQSAIGAGGPAFASKWLRRDRARTRCQSVPSDGGPQLSMRGLGDWRDGS